MGFRLPRIIAMGMTFMFVHLSWVFFRANSLTDAVNMLHRLAPGAADWQALNINLLPSWASIGLPFAAPSLGVMLLVAILLALLPMNSDQLAGRFSARKRECVWAAVLLTLGTLTLGQVTQFLYFNF
jgi:hypothetical protein